LQSAASGAILTGIRRRQAAQSRNNWGLMPKTHFRGRSAAKGEEPWHDQRQCLRLRWWQFWL
jgi:hypothetical protein